MSIKMSSSWSSVCQLNGIHGSSSPLLVPEAGAIPPASLCRHFPAGLGGDHRTDRQPLQGGHFPGASTSQGSCQVKWQLLERRLNPLCSGPPIICHLLMGLINGWRVERGGPTARGRQIHTRVFRAALPVSSQQWVLHFTDGLLLLLNAEGVCV